MRQEHDLRESLHFDTASLWRSTREWLPMCLSAQSFLLCAGTSELRYFPLMLVINYRIWAS